MNVERLVDGELFQIAFVVRDLDAALARYMRVLGGAPWRVFTFSAAIHREAVYQGGPTDFSVRLALNGASPQYELIEPQRGPGVFDTVADLGCFVEAGEPPARMPDPDRIWP